MALSIDTVFQVVDVVQKAIEIYHRIDDVPDTIRKLGRRMERLDTLLTNLEAHLRSNQKHALARLRPSQSQDLLKIVADTRADCDKVYALFDRWEKKIGPMGVQFRDNAFAQVVANAYFALGSSADKLEALAADIELHRRDIHEYMGLMGVQGLQANQNGIQDIRQANQKGFKELQKELKVLHDLFMAQQKAGAQKAESPPAAPVPNPAPPKLALPAPTKPAAGKDDKAKAAKRNARLSPSPSPPRKDYRIIFIDPYNVSRSVCAEALMGLYREWTKQNGGQWRIMTVHSAGFFAQRQGDCGDIIEKLNYKHSSYKLNMAGGNNHPAETATAAVFDNKNFGSIAGFKKQMQSEIKARRSRGIKRDVFRDYDMILVFTGREHDNMIRLKSALIASDGDKAVAKGKGRVIHLGQYLTLDGIPREIVDPPKNKDGTQTRDQWNWKVSQLKIAIRGFLKKEMDWEQPKGKLGPGDGSE